MITIKYTVCLCIPLIMFTNVVLGVRIYSKNDLIKLRYSVKVVVFAKYNCIEHTEFVGKK